jgi:hypothetical protein
MLVIIGTLLIASSGRHETSKTLAIVAGVAFIVVGNIQVRRARRAAP